MKAIKAKKPAKRKSVRRPKVSMESFQTAVCNVLLDMHGRYDEMFSLVYSLQQSVDTMREAVDELAVKFGTIKDVSESLAVQTSHVRRLLGEKAILEGRVAKLETRLAEVTLPAFVPQHPLPPPSRPDWVMPVDWNGAPIVICEEMDPAQR